MDLSINSNGKVALFVLKGKIGWDNSRLLDAQIHKMVEGGRTFIVFNLDEVTFLCSGGVGALVYHMKKVQTLGGDIYIVSNSDYIQFLFATIGFNVIFKGRIFETFEEFSQSVLASKGILLNPLQTYARVVGEEEDGRPGASRSEAA